MSYLFRDTDRAARRLQVLAEVYKPSSEAFLHDVVHTRPQLALDLGCGPGYTTHLLAETTGSARTIGLDSSRHFIELASGSASERISFLQHDVTQTPFPSGQADLLFCRMLLTHLKDARATIERWLTQLKPGGLLLIEEVNWIHTDRPIFRDYLAIVSAMLEQQRNQLYIGEQLDTYQPANNDVQRLLSRVYQLPVTSAHAATMFYLNVAAWKNHPFVQQHYPSDQIEQMEDELSALTSSTASNEINWGMRQIAYQKT
ncbi:class I SAM-dependent methyltransferase [Dictyobacter aurantiacus]|uniref:Methyltransferase type 11 domain-containing protein n=1 Tax=Dictyobacter aurantiacus TaxID=1936993 RepID=A0A401ZL14_9CHLR|nr:methyltransferase domain-containing protein [Dictyobacter aurantiacus]GCE07500.1 hypothetical protein KDAU_48290 [Dictyobacter aurantiacus]